MQVLHASEIQELQIRVEEGEEKVKTIEGLVTVLREERDQGAETTRQLERRLGVTRERAEQAEQELQLLRHAADTSMSC